MVKWLEMFYSQLKGFCVLPSVRYITPTCLLKECSKKKHGKCFGEKKVNDKIIK